MACPLDPPTSRPSHQRRTSTHSSEFSVTSGIPLLPVMFSSSPIPSKTTSALGSPGRLAHSSIGIIRQRRIDAVTKCLFPLFVLSAVFCGLLWLLWESSFGSAAASENQLCSVKRWRYPTCIPSAKKILTHMPTPDEWVQYRAAYQRAVLDPSHFSLEPKEWINGSVTGFAVPVRIEYSKERGRGVYAAAFIPKGQKVWDNRFTARIHSECEGKRFVNELTEEQACNVIIWGYSTDHGTGQLEWGVDLDPASFTNAANNPSEVNAADRVDPERALVPGGHSMWTTKDVEEGEELLSSYDGLRTINPKKNLFWQLKGVFMAWGFGPFLF